MNKIRKIDTTKTPVPLIPDFGVESAGIFYDSGRKGIAVNVDGSSTRRLLPETWTEQFVLSGASAATAANFNQFYTAPYGVEVVSVRARFSAAGGAGAAVGLKKAPSGTGTDAGTDVLASNIALTGTANTNVSGTLHATVANRKLAAGDSLGAVDAGTLTGLTDLVIIVELKRTPDVA